MRRTRCVRCGQVSGVGPESPRVLAWPQRGGFLRAAGARLLSWCRALSTTRPASQPGSSPHAGVSAPQRVRGVFSFSLVNRALLASRTNPQGSRASTWVFEAYARSLVPVKAYTSRKGVFHTRTSAQHIPFLFSLEILGLSAACWLAPWFLPRLLGARSTPMCGYCWWPRVIPPWDVVRPTLVS